MTAPTDEIAIRLAAPHEYTRVREAYAEWGYAGTALDSDFVFTAWSGDTLIGIVRRATEHGHTMLRGMHVAPAWRARGVGTMLLGAFEAALSPGPCFCIPFAHLERFYAEIGFEKIAELDAPPHLVERLSHYRAQGRDMIIMQRPAR
jgi:GNAT superfamily N-acetyltransferase